MNREILPTAERWRRYQRDLEAYRRRSLMRRSHPRFHRDLAVIPHLFLLPGKAWRAPLRESAEAVRLALRSRAVWTLDTAARLVAGRGFLAAHDLTGYLTSEDLRWAVEQGLVEEPRTSGLSVDPIYERPPTLIVHVPDEPPPSILLSSGNQVVPWDFLIRDVMGTLGWRPDLLTRLEEVYQRGLGMESDPGHSTVDASLSRAARIIR